jgi:hypothetical protein
MLSDCFSTNMAEHKHTSPVTLPPATLEIDVEQIDLELENMFNKRVRLIFSFYHPPLSHN